MPQTPSTAKTLAPISNSSFIPARRAFLARRSRLRHPRFHWPPTMTRVSSNTLLTLVDRYRQSGVPIEFHLFAHGAHALNMGDRSKLVTIHSSPTEWRIGCRTM